jgi:hypothetical protein
MNLLPPHLSPNRNTDIRKTTACGNPPGSSNACIPARDAAVDARHDNALAHVRIE